jgi:hypothetical protein
VIALHVLDRTVEHLHFRAQVLDCARHAYHGLRKRADPAIRLLQ